MATPKTVKGAINRATGVSSMESGASTRRRRKAMLDAIAAFGQDRRTGKNRLTGGGKRAMANARRRASLGGNGG